MKKKPVARLDGGPDDGREVKIYKFKEVLQLMKDSKGEGMIPESELDSIINKKKRK